MVVCSNSVPTADEKRFPPKRPSFRVVKFFYANPVLNLLTSTKSSVPKPMIPVGSIKCSDIYHKQFSSLCPSQLNRFVVGQNEQVSLIPFSPFSFDSLRLCQWYVRRNQINEKWPLEGTMGYPVVGLWAPNFASYALFLCSSPFLARSRLRGMFVAADFLLVLRSTAYHYRIQLR